MSEKIGNEDGLVEFVHGITSPLRGVKAARAARREEIAASSAASEDLETQRLSGDAGEAKIEDMGRYTVYASIGVLAVQGVDIWARGEEAAVMPGLLGVGGLAVGGIVVTLDRLMR